METRDDDEISVTISNVTMDKDKSKKENISVRQTVDKMLMTLMFSGVTTIRF